jgi:hypothetical protein
MHTLETAGGVRNDDARLGDLADNRLILGRSFDRKETRGKTQHCTASMGMFTGWTVRYALDEVQYVRTILEAVPFAQPLYSYSCET